MRMYLGDFYITELSIEGLELNFEFECGHTESSEFLLNYLTSHFSNLRLRFLNLYYDGLNNIYLINLKTINDKLISEPFDLSFFNDEDLKKLKLDFRIVN